MDSGDEDDLGGTTIVDPLELCPACLGTGLAPASLRTILLARECGVCAGEKFVPPRIAADWIAHVGEATRVCPACSSVGSPRGCTFCVGQGRVTPAQENAWRERKTIPVPPKDE